MRKANYVNYTFEFRPQQNWTNGRWSFSEFTLRQELVVIVKGLSSKRREVCFSYSLPRLNTYVNYSLALEHPRRY